VRLFAGLAAWVVVGLAIQGCDPSVNSRETSERCEPKSYDLTQPPSRKELGMEPGRSFMDVSCDDGFMVTLTLPDDAVVSVTARGVSADSYSTANPETGSPTTVDVHSVALGVDEAVQLATGLADSLGIDAQPVQNWRHEVGTDPSGGNVDSLFMRSRLGYLTAEMQVQHLGVSGNNYLHLIFTWR